MKLLIIVSSLSTGGAQRVASNLIMGLPTECDVDILLNNSDDVTYPYRGNIIDIGMPIEKNKGSLLYQIRVFVRRIVKLSKLKKTGGYDAAISFMDSANIANILTKNKRTKVIATIHTKLSASGFDWKYRYIVFPLVKLLYGSSDGVVTVSKGVEKDLIETIKYKGNNLVTIYNGFNFVDIRRLSEQQMSNTEQSIYDGCTTLISVGRLSKAKGYWHLLRAMKIITKEKSNVKLLIIGEGEQEKYLKQLCEELGIDEKVVFLGYVQNPFKYVAKADIFVMSSIFEGLPSSLIEALILKKPCVVTDFQSGAREILSPSNHIEEIQSNYLIAEYGIITPVCGKEECDAWAPITQEEQLLANAINLMIDKQELREEYVNKSQEAVRKFDIKIMVGEYIKLVKSGKMNEN